MIAGCLDYETNPATGGFGIIEFPLDASYNPTGTIQTYKHEINNELMKC